MIINSQLYDVMRNDWSSCEGLSARWRQSLNTSSAQPLTLDLLPRTLTWVGGLSVPSRLYLAIGLGGRISTTLMMERRFSARDVRFGGRGTVFVDSSDGRRSRRGGTKLAVLSVGEVWKHRKEFRGEVM